MRLRPTVLRARPPVRRRTVSAAVSLACALTGLLLIIAPPALAAREFKRYMTGFNGEVESFSRVPTLIAIDDEDNVWGVCERKQTMCEFDSYPSETRLPLTWDLERHLGEFGMDDFAIDNSTGNLFFPASYYAAPGTIEVFKRNGEYKEQWNDGSEASQVAVDNSGGPTQSVVYVTTGGTYNQNTGATTGVSVKAFDSEGKPVEFSRAAEYIEGNAITGTPSGPFESSDGPITVDSLGNIYVSTGGNVDEYESSGAFVREFTGAGAPGRFNAEGIAVDPTNRHLVVVSGSRNGSGEGESVIDEFTSAGKFIEQIKETTPGDPFNSLNGKIAINSKGYLYIVDQGVYSLHGLGQNVDIFSPQSQEGPKIEYLPVTELGSTSGTLNANIAPSGVEVVTSCNFEYGAAGKHGTVPCSTTSFSTPTDVSAPISGLTSEIPYHYHVVLTTEAGETFEGQEQIYTPHHVVGIQTESATLIGDANATVHGSFIGNGEPTEYYFDWGTGPSYGNKTPTATIDAAGGHMTDVEAEISGLNPVTIYHYRLVATNGSGTSYASDHKFETLPLPPVVTGEVSTAVHSDTAVLHTQINPGGGITTYQFEYVDADQFAESGFEDATKTPEPYAEIGTGFADLSASVKLSGLESDTTYYWRVVATNATKTTDGAEQTFNTFPYVPLLKDHCPNAHVRQQTGAALLLDCRAYELVSAANTGGYDVESDLVAGQTPFAGYPEAENPSPGPLRRPRRRHPRHRPPHQQRPRPLRRHPRRRRLDHRIRRHPRRQTPSRPALLLDPSGADASLETFAFGGTEGCSPCFEDGYTGIPVRLPNGELVQGMAGPGEPGPAAKPDGYIAKRPLRQRRTLHLRLDLRSSPKAATRTAKSRSMTAT